VTPVAITTVGLATPRAGETLPALITRVTPREPGAVILASCNGAATEWDAAAWRASFAFAGDQPVASAACASGLHALYLARVLIDTGAARVTAVAADLATAPAHRNFEALRVLSEAPAPFTTESSGFALGGAAVAVTIERAELAAPDAPRLVGPLLGGDLDGADAADGADRHDGLDRLLAAIRPHDIDLVIGQGTGPFAADRAELAAIARHIAPDIPLATALGVLGHTLGAASLASVALAARARTASVPELALPYASALDGRPLGAGPSRRTLVACRALGGACGACIVGDAAADVAHEPGDIAGWRTPEPPPPLRDPVLRSISRDAPAARPEAPPDLLLVTLAAPLPPAARTATRILPTSVLEMTPGAIPRLVARRWGFTGPALCLVGGNPESLVAACRASHRRVYRLAIRGMEERDVEWNA
jgi:hypothetical protein